MDNIQKLLDRLKRDRRLKAKYSSKFLNTVGTLFEKYGPGTVKAYLLDKKRSVGDQAVALERVLEIFEEFSEVRANRAVGRLIIKSMDTLTREEGRR